MNIHLLANEISAEIDRQQVLKAAGRFRYSCADLELSNDKTYLVLAEEVGEVARVLMEMDRLVNDLHGQHLRSELVQVAAVACAWIMKLDRIDDLKSEHAHRKLILENLAAQLRKAGVEP